MPTLIDLSAITPADAPRVGGKAAALARHLQAGMPVPPGFVLPTECYNELAGTGLRRDAAFARRIADAFAALGGPVAVRSSATAEDTGEVSAAGQQETVLGVATADECLDAIERCWRSLHGGRAVAYRREQGVSEAGLSIAVVVQKLVPAESAGVLFTRDPQDEAATQMSIEASYGLGESVVSGRVTPDRFTLNFDTGAVIGQTIGSKSVMTDGHGERETPPEMRAVPCLTSEQLSQLATLGRAVERFEAEARDVEWAWWGGRAWLLQARPITAVTAAERAEVRRAVVAELAKVADAAGTVWVFDSVSEVLPEPTPLTWHLVERLLAPDGGFGAMTRDLGGSPDPTLGGRSAYDLVAGRPMANLSRLPRQQFANPPFEYPFAAFKADPKLAVNPKPVLNPARDGFKSWLRLPKTAWRLYKASATPRQLVAGFAGRFSREVLPKFAAEARAALAEDVRALSPADLWRRVREWQERTLVGYARESLKCTVFADLCWATLEQLLKPHLGDGTAAAVGELALHATPPAEHDVAGAVRRLADGRMSRGAFQRRFGHRGPREMELSAPRWGDDPTLLPPHPEPAGNGFADLAERLDTLAAPPADPPSVNEALPRVLAAAKLTGSQQVPVTLWAERLRTYLGLREAAKDGLLLGMAVMRQALVELGRRTELGADLFYATPTEIGAMVAASGTASPELRAALIRRKRERRAALSLEVPAALFSDDLAAIGRALPVPEGAHVWSGTPVSAGTAEAAALVRLDPRDPAPPGLEGYVLVCPSTDPAWVPLFARAKALVLETGGVLSHGAIVAREFGLPAVAGLPGVTRELKDGDRVRVDGGRGTVTRLEEG